MSRRTDEMNSGSPDGDNDRPAIADLPSRGTLIGGAILIAAIIAIIALMLRDASEPDTNADPSPPEPDVQVLESTRFGPILTSGDLI